MLGALILTACGGQGGTSSSSTDSGTNEQTREPSQESKELTKLTFSLGYTTTLETLAPEIAIDKGFFEEEGLEVDLVEYGGGSALMQAYAAGEAKIGISASTTTIQAAAKGVPVKMVAMALNPLAEYVVVRSDLGITDPAQLKGRTIGITRQGSLTEMEAKLVTEQAGLQPGDYNLAPLGTVQAMKAALEEKQADAAVMFGPLVSQMVVDGTGQVLVRMSDVVPQASNEMIGASSSFIEEHPEQIQAFLRGYFKAIQWMKDNPDETIEIISSSFQIAPEVAKDYYESNIEHLSADGVIDRKGLEWTAESLQKLNLVDSKPDLDSMVDDSFTPAN